MSQPLDDQAIERALEDLSGWKCQNDKLTRTFQFNSFKEALSFIVRLGLHAEEQNHHPEIHNVYSTVVVSLCTHDAGDKVTDKDVTLARTNEDFEWT